MFRVCVIHALCFYCALPAPESPQATPLDGFLRVCFVFLLLPLVIAMGAADQAADDARALTVPARITTWRK